MGLHHIDIVSVSTYHLVNVLKELLIFYASFITTTVIKFIRNNSIEHQEREKEMPSVIYKLKWRALPFLPQCHQLPPIEPPQVTYKIKIYELAIKMKHQDKPSRQPHRFPFCAVLYKDFECHCKEPNIGFALGKKKFFLLYFFCFLFFFHLFTS